MKNIEATFLGLVNLTPHAVTIVTTDGKTTIPSRGVVRAVMTTAQTGRVWLSPDSATSDDWAIPVLSEGVGSPVYAGDHVLRDGDVIIVSRLAADAIARNGGLLNGYRVTALYPTDLVRDADGVITGCRALGAIGGDL